MSTPSEEDILNVKALLLLQSSKEESTDTLWTMLQEEISKRKYEDAQKLKSIPPDAELKYEIDENKIDETSSLPGTSGMTIDNPPASPYLNVCDSDDSYDGLENLEGKCSVCKNEKTNSKSALIECYECHTPYHKECHKPPVAEDLSDPRIVWYCRACNNSLNKNTARIKSTSLKASSSISKSSKTTNSRKEATSSTYEYSKKWKSIPPVAASKAEIVKTKIDATSSSPGTSGMTIDNPPASPYLNVCDSDDSYDGLENLEGKCSVCKNEKTNNKSALIECYECHTLYHKECHKPPVAEDLSDPRIVWYCRACNKSLNKNTARIKSTSSKASSSISKSSKTTDSRKEPTSSTYEYAKKWKSIPPVAASKAEIVKTKIDETGSLPGTSGMAIDNPPASPYVNVCDSDDSYDGVENLDGKCSVCKNEKTNNKSALVECYECHTLYHKECHKPPVAEDLSDARIVWYCRACKKPHNKNIKSTSSKASSSTSKSSKTTNSKKKATSSKSTTSNPSKGSSKRTPLQSIKKLLLRK